MRREELYLTDIVEAANAIEVFLCEIDKNEFIDNDLLRSAVLQKLSITGEAASRLSKEFQNKHPEIEWADIVGFRNIIVHAYFSVDWPIVWTTAKHDIPDLKQKIVAILYHEFPGAVT